MNKRKLIKKVFKAGIFHRITTGPGWVSWRHGRRTFSWQETGKPFAGCGEFRSGYVTLWEEMAPTYESEYNNLGKMPRASCHCDFQANTDNPDFILRNALAIVG
jgi:hypothetical protein